MTPEEQGQLCSSSALAQHAHLPQALSTSWAMVGSSSASLKHDTYMKRLQNMTLAAKLRLTFWAEGFNEEAVMG